MDVVDYIENEDGTFVPHGTTTYGTPYGYAGRAGTPHPEFHAGLGDVYDALTVLINDLTAGNRARVAAEAMIIAGVARDPNRLRQLAENNAPVEEYLSEIDMNALIRVIRSASRESIATTAQTAAQYAATFAAGFASKYFWDRMSG